MATANELSQIKFLFDAGHAVSSVRTLLRVDGSRLFPTSSTLAEASYRPQLQAIRPVVCPSVAVAARQVQCVQANRAGQV